MGSAPDASEPWVEAAQGVLITVRLTPRANRDAIDGVETLSDGRRVVKLRVRALPSEGEANAALIAPVQPGMTSERLLGLNLIDGVVSADAPLA